MELKDVAVVIGMVTGPIGLAIALLVYFRDRAVVTVDLQWDREMFGPGADAQKTYWAIIVHNVGRRSVYVSHLHIRVPPKQGSDSSPALFPPSGLTGCTLPEGAAPRTELADQAGFERHARIWWKLRATAVDAAGRHYHSPWPEAAPSFGKDVIPPRGAIFWNKIRNRMRRVTARLW